MLSETAQAELIMSMLKDKSNSEDVLKEKITNIISDVKQSSFNNGYDQGIMYVNED